MTKNITTLQRVQNTLDEHITTLNTEYEHYKDHLIDSYSNTENTQTVAELVRDADIDSIEFNIGFEQGYMRALEEIVNVDTGNKDLIKELQKIQARIEGDTFTADNIQALINKLSK